MWMILPPLIAIAFIGLLLIVFSKEGAWIWEDTYESNAKARNRIVC